MRIVMGTTRPPTERIRRRLPDAVWNKTVLVTGASTGIGQATAILLAEAGAVTLLASRNEAALRAVRDRIEEAGGRAHVYRTDLTDEGEIRALVSRVLGDHGGIDILVNNAGMSIRRPVRESFDRIRDYRRTMALNYFGPLTLTLGLVPSMIERGRGHVINVSTLGAQTGAPNFSAYLASKAALDAFTRSLSAETHAAGIAFTTVYMPLVRTPMAAPTPVYRRIPSLSPEEAASIIGSAVVRRPARTTTLVGTSVQTVQALAPGFLNGIFHLAHDRFMRRLGERSRP